jgi:starvation-inducible DNA-binding protein
VNDELIDELKMVVASLVVFKFKAHGYHWNVEGPDFKEYHSFFSEIYEDVDGSIDPFAENILKLGGKAPYRLSRFNELSIIKESEVTTDPAVLSADLLSDNETLIEFLMAVFDTANNTRQQGIANFIAERIDQHQKWSWQLRASITATSM